MNFMSGRAAGFHEDLTGGARGMSSSSSSSSSSHHRHEHSDDIEREHMFDKVVTPSDVGKLNRLVIPKQHAEKYFPLDPSTNEKGLLLNFEDRNGKPWRFRYSYWNSSQSYVMTKGWSRFVKEKKLDAGDIVSFHRGASESSKDRLFIDWCRRPNPAAAGALGHTLSIPHNHQYFPFNRPCYSNQYPFVSYHHMNYQPLVNGNPCRPGGSIMCLRSAQSPHHQQMVFESVPVVQGKAAAKRLRLFGVTMDCPISESGDDPCDMQQLQPNLDSNCSLPSPQLRPYRDDEDKGKSSMSLDLDI